jgi:hypothetical protein
MYVRLRPVGHFAGDFAEMCIVMCVGLAVLDAQFYGVARIIGYSDPAVQLPEVSTLIVAVNMAVPMIVWMRFRGHQWRPICGDVRRHVD